MDLRLVPIHPKEFGSNNLNIQDNQKRYFDEPHSVNNQVQTDTVQLTNKKDTIKKVGIVTTVLASTVGLLYLVKGKNPFKQVVNKIGDIANEVNEQIVQKVSRKKVEIPVQNTAKEAEEKLAQEVTQKAAEEARIAAEKAQQEAVKKAAEEARIAAEKVKQEAAQKAAEEAKLAADKLHQKAITALDDVAQKYNANEIDFNLPIDKLENEIFKFKSSYGKTTTLTNEIISVLKEFEKNGTTISVEELKRVLTNSMTNPDGIEKLVEKLATVKAQKSGPLYEEAVKYAEQVLKDNPGINQDLNSIIESQIKCTVYTIGERVQSIGNRNEYLRRIIDRIDKTPKAEQQKISEYLKEIISAEIKSEQAKKAAFNSQIKSMLKYGDDTSDEVIELTKQERQDLADYFNKLFGTNEFNADTNLGFMASKWRHKYISGFTPDLPQRTEMALMRSLGRACPDQYYSAFPTIKPDFEHAPLCRWMKIHEPQGFLKQFETPGSEYSFGRIQSFSKNFNQGEYHSFTDWQSCYNVKLIVHPKSSSGKTLAIDLGAGKYGDMEAVYPSGQKFRYLGKTKVTSSIEDFPGKEPFDTFYRWEIHLQEI